MPAALITSMVKTLVVTAGENRLKPEMLLEYINEKIFNQTGGNFLTAFYGVYDRENHFFTYAKGAHNAPYLIREDKIISLESSGRILGIFESISFEKSGIQLIPGDKIILYTDGLTEAINELGIEFEEFLPQILLNNSHLSVNDLMTNICKELFFHRNDEEFDDDICIVALEIKPEI
jgi:sigma-B regulation protein RsbU (phosphoserine phosphatase)